MANAHAVSVIIPLCDEEKYLAACLKSLLAQTFKDFEVILINDCSSDAARKVLKSYLKKFDGRLNIYDNQQSSGISAARNKGLYISRGEYVFFLDAKDSLLADGLERMYGLAKYFDVDVVNFTGHYDLSSDGKKRIHRRLKKPTATGENIFETNLEWRVKGLLKSNFYWAPWRRMLRRDFLIKEKLFFLENLRKYEDQIWTYGLLLCAGKILHTPLAAYLYRKSDDSRQSLLLRVKKIEIPTISLLRLV